MSQFQTQTQTQTQNQYPSNRLFPPWLDAEAENGDRSMGPAVIFLRLLVASLGNPDNPLDLSELCFDESLVGAVRSFQIGLGFEGDNADGNFGQATRGTLKYLRGVDVETIPANVFRVGLRPTFWAGPHHEGLLPWPLDERTLVGRPCPRCERSDAYMAFRERPFYNFCVSCGHKEDVSSLESGI